MNSESRSGRGNLDEVVVDAFGDEWTRFDQHALSDHERAQLFDSYFAIFPWERLPANAVGFDFGCGSGRWARLVAPRVGRLHCIDASPAALGVARRALEHVPNCEFHLANPDTIPLPEGSVDFGYSLGVLHHIPDTDEALARCVSKLRKGAPFLLYLYYRFDNRPLWYVWTWRASEAGRFLVSRLPYPLRYPISQVIAATVYFPLARLARLVERMGFPSDRFPLSYYRHRSFYLMRTDALDRFGTRLEKRFTRSEVRQMMTASGLTDIVFSERPPFWCAVGIRA